MKINRPLFVLIIGLLAGCATTGEQPLQEVSAPVIALSEGSGAEPALRSDFDEAVSLMHQERYDEAITLLDKVIQVSQQYTAPYINMAMAYRKTARLKEAETYLQKAMMINPGHPATLNEYALLYRETGRYAEARELYQRLVAQFPQYMPARKNFGILCELYLNDMPCAIINYQAYLDVYPDDEEVRLWLTGLSQ